MVRKSCILKMGKFLIVTLDSDMSDGDIFNLQSEVLEEIERGKIKGILIHVLSLNVIDSFMARSVSDTASMCSLMNVKTVVVGVQPSVAITMAELGLELKGVYTAVDIDRGMELLKMMDKEKV